MRGSFQRTIWLFSSRLSDQIITPSVYFFADFKHFAPADGVDELFEIRAVGGRIILRPDVADDFLLGKR